jgi:hypothetical protein
LQNILVETVAKAFCYSVMRAVDSDSIRQKGNNMNEFPHKIVVDGSRASLRLMTGKRLALAGLAICTVMLSSPRACGASGAIVDIDPGTQVSLQPGPGKYAGFNELHGDGMVGWTFHLQAPLTVTAVGWYDESQVGLSRPFQVGLWLDLVSEWFTPADSPRQLLGNVDAGITIPGGTTATLLESWRIVPLATPLTLAPGYYELGGLDSAATPDVIKYVWTDAYAPIPPTAPGLTIGAFFYADSHSPSSTFGFTSAFYAGRGLELGPMLFTSIPEPCTIGLVSLGAVMVLLVRRQRFCPRRIRCG